MPCTVIPASVLSVTLLMSSVPPFTTTDDAVFSAAASLTLSVPAVMLVVPLKLLPLFDSVSVLVPALLKLPVPETTPAKVWFAPCVTVRVPALTFTVPPVAPPPDRVPIVSVLPLTSSVTPTAFASVTAPASARTPLAPNLTVPALMSVPPV